MQQFTDNLNLYGLQVARTVGPPPATPVSVTPSSLGAGQPSVNLMVTATSTNGSAFTETGAGWLCHLGASIPGVTINSVTRTGPTTATVNVSTVNATAGLKAITIINPDGQSASSAPIFRVTVNVAPPVGFMDTPAENATARGELAVTGWALDDGGIASVDIFRSPVAGETPNALVFLGRASFIRGARPDVAAAYPDMADNDNAGWGFMVLTNFLPNQGNGTFDLHAIATDIGGMTTLLGSRRIIATNATSTVPFGTIDTPGQGETVSGTIINFGWALAPQPRQIPINGSTIDVYIDGVWRGHPVYNNVRSDIATLFPGYYNTSSGRGAIGYFVIDTRTLEQRTAHDSLGRSRRHRAGIGCRQPLFPGAELIGGRKLIHGVGSTTKDVIKTSRRALLGLGALGAAARAEAQVRTPRRSRPSPVPAGDMRLLHRTTYGPTTDDVTWMAALGYDAYLNWQLNYETIGDPDVEARLAALTTVPLAPFSLYQADSALVQRELAEATIMRRTFSNRQLFERMVEFWADHFNTNIGQVEHPQESRGSRRLSPQCADDLLRDAQCQRLEPGDDGVSQQHDERRPAGSHAEPELRTRAPGTAHARRQRRLHANRRGRSGAVLHRLACATATPAMPRAGTFFYDANRHDNGSKLVLGVPIAAGGGINDGLNVLHDPGQPPQHGALRVAQAAALAARPTIPRRRSSTTSPASSLVQAGTSRRWCGASCRTKTSCGRRCSSSAPSTYIISALRVLRANMTSLNTIRGTYINGSGNAPFAWGPPDGYPHAFEYWGGLPLPRWNYAFNLANNGISGAGVDLSGHLIAGQRPRRRSRIGSSS